MRKQVFVVENDHRLLLFECPHCDLIVQVLLREICCGVFRHAIMKNDHTHINAHLSKAECEILVAENKVYGCCKPFRLFCDEKKWVAEACDYI